MSDMHIFLTGNVQVGKSTVLQRVLSLLDGKVGGFCSGFDHERAKADRWLYMWDAACPPAKDEAHRIVRFTDDKPEVFLQQIDEIGGGALRRAREGGVQLIVMDECGRLERHAEGFKQEVLAALDGNIPILGVVRQGYSGWLDQIRNHPKVTLLTVTEENRETLYEQILSMLQK